MQVCHIVEISQWNTTHRWRLRRVRARPARDDGILLEDPPQAHLRCGDSVLGGDRSDVLVQEGTALHPMV